MRKNIDFHIYNKKTLVLLLVFLFSFFFISFTSASENLSTFYTLNENNTLNITSNRVIFTNFDENNTNSFYIIKDYSNLNGNFLYQFDINVSQILSPSNYGFIVFDLAQVNSTFGGGGIGSTIIYIKNNSQENFTIYWSMKDSFEAWVGTPLNNILLPNVTYYINVRRTENIINLSIYSDLNRTNLIGTIHNNLESQAYIDIGGVPTFNYIKLAEGVSGADGQLDTRGSFYIENFNSIVEPEHQAGISGNIIDYAFNYGKEDNPVWYRLLFSLVIVFGVYTGIRYFIDKYGNKLT